MSWPERKPGDGLLLKTGRGHFSSPIHYLADVQVHRRFGSAPDRLLYIVGRLRACADAARRDRQWKRDRVRQLLAEHAPLGSTARNAVTAGCHLRDLGHPKLAAMLDRMYRRDLPERIGAATPEQLADLDVSIAAHAPGEGWDPGTRDFGAERKWRERSARRWGP